MGSGPEELYHSRFELPNMLASILDVYLSIFHVEGVDLIWCLI